MVKIFGQKAEELLRGPGVRGDAMTSPTLRQLLVRLVLERRNQEPDTESAD